METSTFTGDTIGTDEVRAALHEHGYEVGTPDTVERVVLDTFDGRAHAAGMRIEAERGRDLLFKVTGPDGVPATALVQAVPRFAADLPPGPLRSRLEPVLDVRALLPRVTLAATRWRAVGRNRDGAAAVEAVVFEHLTAVPNRSPLPPWTIEIHAKKGSGRRASRLQELLRDLGLKPVDGDTLEAAIAAAGVSRTGFDSSLSIPLPPDTPTLDGFAAVLSHLADAIAANWQPTIQDVDPEFLHDLRVAVRRTRSVLSHARHVLPADVGDRYRAEFKWLGDITSPARDLDVYVLEWDGYVADLSAEDAAALEPVLAEIKSRRAAEHRRLSSSLASRRAQRLLPGWRAWLNDPRKRGAAGRDADRPLAAVVVNRIQRAHRRVLDQGRSIEPASPGEFLHDLRKDAKKLRYLLECFGGVLPAGARKDFVKRLKTLQDNLGEHQDAEVHIAQLEALAHDLSERKANVDTLLATGRIVQTLHDRRRASRDEFHDRFAEYDSKPTRRALHALLSDVT